MSGFTKFLAGAIIGGVAVALLTPTTGEELRRRIKDVLREKGLIPDDEIDQVVEMIATEMQETAPEE